MDCLAEPIQEAHLVAAVTRGLQNVVRAEANRRARHARDMLLERVERLTAREREVAVCLIAGLPNKEIAADLGMTETTAKVHCCHIMAKLEEGSVAELIRLAASTRPSPILPRTTGGQAGSRM